ncbi:MAG: hypothetical protein N5P05_002105 [Chroococcopsis gigantea SAG 12.99]|jgi:hypothetical protein|nr:transposase [Chlorogloea purpurea SAG 13.99]MDV3000499.1 hypothetical protein [Chroococcopsis gigantea SAG 12.99]
MPQPLLSIVIPTREGFSDHWITELLKVKGDVEFILIHPPGAKPYPTDDARMKQIVSSLRGEIIQRITGFMNATAPHVLTINCDEYLHPDIQELAVNYFNRFPDSWVLRLSKQGYVYGDTSALSSHWLPLPNIHYMKTCSKAERTSHLFGQKDYLLDLPIAPLENKFNPICLLGQRLDQSGNHVENFDKKIWKNSLVQTAIKEITDLMSLGGPIKYIPFWCLDRLLGLYIQAKFYEKDKIIGHWLPLPEQIRIEDNPPEYKRTKRFYFIAEVMLLKSFPQYGYLWNLILCQVTSVPIRAFDSVKRKISRPLSVESSLTS